MAETTNTPASQDFFSIVGETFTMIKESWEALLLNIATFIILAVIPLVFFIFSFIAIAGIVFTNIDNNTVSISSWDLSVIAVLVLAMLVISCLFFPALMITQIESAKGNKIEFTDAFKRGIKFVWRYLGLMILSGLLVIIGLILLILPGILVAFFLSMSLYILIDKNTKITEAMRQSYYLVKENWIWIIAIWIVNIAVSVVGNIPYIGGLISLGLSIAYFCLPALIYIKIRKN